MDLSLIIESEMRGLISFTSTSEHLGKSFRQNSNIKCSTAENNVVPNNSVLENTKFNLK